ncbi:uncharacterized protein METZ01_LOCUS105577 [marine metagenome]|uniref:DUF3568 family protein n=1 Tax=marine metagenome TaxID=408172 RepID=A0A381WLF4_9ZZZZ
MTIAAVLLEMPPMTFRLFLLCVASSLAAVSVGCISTPQGKQFGVPGVRDTVVSRYERPIDQVISSAREVLSRTGTITGDDVVNNAVSAKIDNRSVWVSVSEVEPLVTEVKVRVRSSRGTADQAMAAEIDKQIAIGLVVSP